MEAPLCIGVYTNVHNDITRRALLISRSSMTCASDRIISVFVSFYVFIPLTRLAAGCWFNLSCRILGLFHSHTSPERNLNEQLMEVLISKRPFRWCHRGFKIGCSVIKAAWCKAWFRKRSLSQIVISLKIAWWWSFAKYPWISQSVAEVETFQFTYHHNNLGKFAWGKRLTYKIISDNKCVKTNEFDFLAVPRNWTPANKTSKLCPI